MAYTPGRLFFCSKCGWSGQVNGTPRCLPCAAAATRAWRLANPDKRRDQKRRYEHRLRAERPWKVAAYKRSRRAKNPELTKAKWAERSAWLKSGDVTREQLQALFNTSKGRCYLCGIEVRARFIPHDPRGFDHIVPRSKGGLHTASNLAVCCGSCNARKSDNEL
jgi:5-methylcytosine-specific restriction endonuclease McrA